MRPFPLDEEARQLDTQMTRVLQQIVLTAGDVTSALHERSSATAKIHPSKLLSLPELPAYDVLARTYRGCRTNEGRRAVLAEAEDVLRRLRYSSKPTLDLQTAEGRLELGRDPRPAKLIAKEYGFSLQHVYKLRAAAEAEQSRVEAERERLRYDGSEDMRREIAALTGSSYEVAEQFENVSPRSVSYWRRNSRAITSEA